HAVLVDSPAFQRGHVLLVEVDEALVGERRRRTQFALGEGGHRPANGLQVCLDGIEGLGQRDWLDKAGALELEVVFGGDSARVLKDSRDVAIAARGEYGR